MSRPQRIDYEGARHHAMNRGARQAAIFLDGECYGRFLELVGELPERYGLVVHAYALMPNHFHLMLESRSGRLSQAMSFLQSRYSSWLNRRYEWDGPIYRGRFRNRVIEDDDYWRHLFAYLHLNPVRARLCTVPDAADWTSHAVYVGLESRPDWLTCEQMWEYYGSMDAYRDYLRDLQTGAEQPPVGFDSDEIWEGPFSGIVRLNLKAPRGHSSIVPDVAPSDATARADAALLEVRHVLARPLGEILRPVRGRQGNRMRWVVAWWLSRWGRVPGSETARTLGITRSGVNQMASKATRHRESDTLLDDWMTRLEEIYLPG